ncbi:MAG: IclR family transcriptional regulator [Candidatus Binatia bacterium]
MFKNSQSLKNWGYARSLEKACDVLSCFGPTKPSWGISELSRYLGFPKAGVFRIVKTLESKGFLRCRESSPRYELGARIYELTGRVVGEKRWLRQKAAPYLAELNKATGFLVSLRVIENDELLVLDRVEGTSPLTVVYPVGTRLACNHGAAGKLLLAHEKSPEEIRKLIRSGKVRPLAERTIVDFKRLMGEFEKIRRSGYAISDGEALRGVIGLAVPIRAAGGAVKGALALTAPESLCSMTKLKTFIPLLRQAGERLSRDLGCREETARDDSSKVKKPGGR